MTTKTCLAKSALWIDEDKHQTIQAQEEPGCADKQLQKCLDRGSYLKLRLQLVVHCSKPAPQVLVVKCELFQ